MDIPDSKSNIAILLLAAGESKRMGKPKQLLKWGKSTLLNHSIKQAVASKADAVYVVLGANYDQVVASITDPTVTILNHKKWNQGLGSSLGYGVRKLADRNFNGILLMLADQPEVDTSFLNKLISAFEKSQKPIISTAYKKGTGGVPVLFGKSYFKHLLSLSGEIGGKQLIENNVSSALLIEPKNPIKDIDTVEAYEKIYRQYFS